LQAHLPAAVQKIENTLLPPNSITRFSRGRPSETEPEKAAEITPSAIVKAEKLKESTNKPSFGKPVIKTVTYSRLLAYSCFLVLCMKLHVA